MAYQILSDRLDTYVDSGCDIRILRDASTFTELSSASSTTIQLGGEGTVMKPKGRGPASITVIMPDGSESNIPLADALYVPDAASNLLSLRSIISRGGRPEFESNGALTIRDGTGKARLHATMHNNMWCVHTGKTQNARLTIASRDEHATSIPSANPAVATWQLS